ncbi:NAD(P)-binding protein [Jeongeupia sp. USM3]|uniref:NAD(P)-binding protein n=1 Tax=Jeongeupia sp. USM3 TaxID=1906741 RepID=UPI00089DFD77|nr:NAD(P)-binding protein [Jeongeupia sp. USM3]AOX99009.1 hypothetical protein BJP62_00190 [Jeongeupia sp. USM3]
MHTGSETVAGSRIAVVGGGLAGLLSAALLSRRYRVTLYESAATLAKRVVDVTLDGQTRPVDVGLAMFGAASPSLRAMLASLGVGTRDCAATLGVSLDAGRLEWADPDGWFAQRRLLWSPAHLRLLADLRRFRHEAGRLRFAAIATRCDVGQLLAQAGYGDAFGDGYLRPLAAALWQDPRVDIANLPAAALLRHFVEHERGGRRWCCAADPVWRTMLAASIDDVRTAAQVVAIRREALGVLVETAGRVDRVDAVVLAVTSPERLLADADGDESAALAGLKFRTGVVCLHTDRRLLPLARKVRAPVNWLRRGGEACLSLDLNRLQAPPFATPLVLTVDPLIAPASVIHRFERRYPVLDHAARVAQLKLDALQGRRATWYAGAWTGDGLPEDAVGSALRVAAGFGVSPDWGRMRNRSGSAGSVDGPDY